MNREVIVFSTCPDESVAQRIAETLIREQLAACVNRVSGVSSTYLWDGALQNDSEVLLIIKTLESRVPEIEARLGTVHPYELPELVAIPVCRGSERYLAWMRAAVTASEPS
jgi:periplasmic divalent cation tolerance protein